MKAAIILATFFIGLFFVTVVDAGTIRKRLHTIVPTWEYTDNYGNRSTIRKRLHTIVPTYEWNDNKGRSGTMGMDVYGNPTYSSPGYGW